MDDDYEVDCEISCPKCGHTSTHSRECTEIGCEDGFINRYEEDPMWYDEDDEEICPECHGTGIERWCPSCGADLSMPDMRKLIFGTLEES